MGVNERRRSTGAVGILLGMTFFGWTWILLSALGLLVYGNPSSAHVTEWSAIEGEVYVYIAAILPPAILLGVLSSIVVLARRPWTIRLAGILSGCQIPLLLWVTRWEIGALENLVLVAALVSIALATVGFSWSWLRSYRPA